MNCKYVTRFHAAAFVYARSGNDVFQFDRNYYDIKTKMFNIVLEQVSSRIRAGCRQVLLDATYQFLFPSLSFLKYLYVK